MALSPDDAESARLKVRELGARYYARKHRSQTLTPGQLHDLDLRITELVSRVDEDDVSEVVLATNPTTTGEATALHIADLVRDGQNVYGARLLSSTLEDVYVEAVGGETS